jgi:peptidoglycan/LPS O-acetylase OafA/YrhL
LYLFIGIILSTLIFRYFNYGPYIHEFHTISCISDMAVGAIGALMISTFSSFKNAINILPKSVIYLIYLAVILIFLFRASIFESNFVFQVAERFIIAIFFLLVILEQCFSINSIFKLNKYKYISKLGVISYGLYCFHFTSILIVLILFKKLKIDNNFIVDTTLVPITSLLLCIMICNFSYNHIEMPFLKLKDKFAYITKI